MAGYSPGWNDPPSLSYSQYDPSVGKRNLLNKRVPFPLNQSTAPLKLEKQDELLNKSSSPALSNAETSELSSSSENKELSGDTTVSLDDKEILPFVMNTLEKILLENSENCEERRIDEIKQRLKVMKDSWDSKISLPVKHKLLLLAQELSKGNPEAALKIQCILMVDNLREVKQWMVGVKHIIEMERLKALSSNATPQAN